MRPWRRASLALFAALVWSSSPALRAIEESTPRIVAVADVHGSPEAFSRVLRAAELVDETGAWIGGDAILVQTGDLTDRGPGVRAVLDLMRELELSAGENGGRVVSLLGNHEVSNLIGQYDYVSTPPSVFAEIVGAFETESSKKNRNKVYRGWARWARRYPYCAIILDEGASKPRLMSREDWMARTPLGFVDYQEALSPRGEYGAWLRKKSIVVNIQDTLFLHGGLSPELLDMGFRSLDSINAKAAADLAQFDRDREWLEAENVIPRHATLNELLCAVAYELDALAQDELDTEAEVRNAFLEDMRGRLPSYETWFLLDPRGPVWFRGYAKWSEETGESQLAPIFEAFGGKRVVVGHTPQPGAITARFDDRVFLVDTTMAYPELGGRAVAIEIHGDAITAVSENGRLQLAGPKGGLAPLAPLAPLPSREPGTVQPETEATRELETAPNDSEEKRLEPREAGSTFSAERGWLGPDGSPLPFSDESAVLTFLREARVLERRTTRKGVTEPHKLLLEKDGVRAHAVFHDVHIEEQRRRERDRLVMNFRDSYRNVIAAYELSRLLEVTNLPPATLRRVRGREGSVQLWIENAYDESERLKPGSKKALSMRQRRRRADMLVFDNLINNMDRNQGNMLYDSRGDVWMIDHTRAFNGSNRLPSPGRVTRCSRGLLAAIRELEEDETRERLKRSLRRFEIKALFERRSTLLKILDEKIASDGEVAVLFSYDDLDDAVAVSYHEDDIPASPDS